MEPIQVKFLTPETNILFTALLMGAKIYCVPENPKTQLDMRDEDMVKTYLANLPSDLILANLSECMAELGFEVKRKDNLPNLVYQDYYGQAA